HSIVHNYVGTNAAGTAAMANGFGIHVMDGTSITIGSASAGMGNLISGNTTAGIAIDASTSLTVIGNNVGLDITGTTIIGNSEGGIGFSNSTGIAIGGS